MIDIHFLKSFPRKELTFLYFVDIVNYFILLLLFRVSTDILEKTFERERASRIWNKVFPWYFQHIESKKVLFYDIIRLFQLSWCRSSSTRSGTLQILKTNIEELMIEKLTKTNTKGIVCNKSNKNSSNRMDL